MQEDLFKCMIAYHILSRTMGCFDRRKRRYYVSTYQRTTPSLIPLPHPTPLSPIPFSLFSLKDKNSSSKSQ